MSAKAAAAPAKGEKHIGMEDKIVHIVSLLKTKYSLGSYEMAFHLDPDRNKGKGEVFYDRVIESIEDVGGFRARFRDKSSVDIPLTAVNDYQNPKFLEKWGESIMKTRREP